MGFAISKKTDTHVPRPDDWTHTLNSDSEEEDQIPPAKVKIPSQDTPGEVPTELTTPEENPALPCSSKGSSTSVDAMANTQQMLYELHGGAKNIVVEDKNNPVATLDTGNKEARSQNTEKDDKITTETDKSPILDEAVKNHLSSEPSPIINGTDNK